MALSNTFSVYKHLQSFLFLLFLWFSLNLSHVYGAIRGGEDKPYHVVPVKSLVPKHRCTKTTSGSTVGSMKLKVTHTYGPCSPIGHTKPIPTSDEIFLYDKIRVHSINGETSGLNPTGESRAALPASDRSTGANNYAVTIGFGTPKRDYTLIFDTGSDTTWMQCQPCHRCYDQSEPIFDPSLSSTYQNGSCKSNENSYTQKYGDGSYSSGFIGCDKVTLEPADVIKKFEFGCGQNNSPGFGSAAGMLGLGKGDTSLISQTASIFGKSFSYCLPTSPSSTGYLLFGKHAKSSSSSLKFTPLLPNPPNYPSYYVVELVDITVGTKKLNLSPKVLSSPGTIIDSGTVITRLPSSVYLALRTAFRASMSKYPSAPPTKLLDTCYDFSKYNNVAYPKIVFHFGGKVDVSLDPSGIIWRESINQVCLAFAARESDRDFTIIGNTQQQALNVFYDLKGGRIGFGTRGCHN